MEIMHLLTTTYFTRNTRWVNSFEEQALEMLILRLYLISCIAWIQNELAHCLLINGFCVIIMPMIDDVLRHYVLDSPPKTRQKKKKDSPPKNIQSW